MQQEPYLEETVDLRDVVSMLWGGRWIIFSIMLLMAILAFVFSFWIIPKKYRATAYVVINDPVLRSGSDSEFFINIKLPDLASIVERSTSKAIVDNVSDAIQLDPTWNIEENPVDGEMFTAATSGKDQLRLEVLYTDPERAATLANVWAEQLASEVNLLYGEGMVSEDLDAQITLAKERYAQAESAWEVELSQNQVDALDARLKAAKFDLACVHDRSGAKIRLLEDLQTLEENLRLQDSEGTISLGSALALITLERRASASEICAGGQGLDLQLESDTPVYVNNAAGSDTSVYVNVADADALNVNVVDALNVISQLQTAVHKQQSSLIDEQTRLETLILSLQRDMANAQYQFNQRDQELQRAQEFYVSLLQQQSLVDTFFVTKIAAVSAPAVVPTEKASPKTIMVTALAGAFGLILGVLLTFGMAWWQDSNGDRLSKK